MRGSRIHSAKRNDPTRLTIGSDYGGWAVLPQRLDSSSIVYSVGVGQDVSFDLGLIERCGCTVHAFDPTPICAEWVAGQSLPKEFVFHPIGLGGEDGETEFNVPAVAGHVSFSRHSAEGSRETVTCPIRRLETHMNELGHVQIDLLKMDIEGFEYEVIHDMIASATFPKQLLVEFHHGMYGIDKIPTKKAVDLLEVHGYELFWVSNVGNEYAFVRGGSVES